MTNFNTRRMQYLSSGIWDLEVEIPLTVGQKLEYKYITLIMSC